MGEGRSGGGGMALLLLLVGVAAGGWNYHRNYQLEQAERGRSRFAGYDSEGLTQLAEAYRLEAKARDGEYQKLRAGRTVVRDTQGVREGVREFERVQRSSNRLREITTELATREARAREIEEELARRARLSSGMALHLERLTGIPLAG